MRILNRFPFIIAIISLMGWLFSFIFRPPEKNLNPYLVGISIFLAGVYWIWILFDVIGNISLKRYQRNFWLILVISIPFFGAILYQVMHQRPNKIVT
ncbi:MAG: PLDc N-terminal domain-containing protein [Chitinophagaceae bacterium]|nr:PLDc N-terminal domain-containing protein [Chitinophagaceae bacterium]